jgi:iron-sulfur cluster repair protein YtfE (RIC family)
MSVLDKIVDAITPPESEEQRAEARTKARSAAHGGDWLSAILDHHEQIEQAFAQTRLGPDAHARRTALKRLGELLTAHSMAEEAVVYPALAQIGKPANAGAAYAEQAAAKLQMAAIERLDPMSQEFIDKLDHLKGAVAHHVYKEESDWFIDLKEKATPAAQQMVAERYGEEYGRYMRGGEQLQAASGVAGEPRSFAQDPGVSPRHGP